MEKWEELVGGALLPAERQAIDACRKGQECVLGDGTRPEGPDDTREIRASVLRQLIIGGVKEDPTHNWGVDITGAYVTGALDLGFATAKGPTGLFDCLFDQAVMAMQTRFEFLNLSGSRLPALNAQGVKVASHVFLRGGFHATGEVSLAGAVIGGGLECDGGRFETEEGFALNAQAAQITGNVFLRGGFHATGEVRLSGAVIGGQLDCVDSTFENRVEGGRALNAQEMRCEGGLFFRSVTCESGIIDLIAAHVGSLVDDLASWPKGGRVALDGFTYDRFAGGAPTGSKARLDWLSRGDRWGDEFFPQPYGQCAKVLRAMGHERAAKDILVARDSKIAAEEWVNARPTYGWGGDPLALLKAMASRGIAMASHLLIDYGHRPLKALVGLMVLWLVTVCLAAWAWKAGDMVPISDVILTSENWAAIHDAEHPANAWEGSPEGQAWESFSRYAWAADVVIPILDFGQTEAWAPTTSRGMAGYTLWWGKWVLSGFGWIILAFAAAGVTGVARRQD